MNKEKEAGNVEQLFVLNQNFILYHQINYHLTLKLQIMVQCAHEKNASKNVRMHAEDTNQNLGPHKNTPGLFI